MDGMAGERHEWVQVDGYGEFTGSPFLGTVTELRAHLARDLPPDAVSGPAVAGIYVRSLGRVIEGPLVTLRTPWGGQRWIHRPAVPPARRGAWLLRL